MLAPTEELPPEVSRASADTCMSSRETDLWRMLQEGLELSAAHVQPTIELKHSALGRLAARGKGEGQQTCWLATDRVMSDGEYTHLAGNAFSGGCFAAMLLLGIAHLDFSIL